MKSLLVLLAIAMIAVGATACGHAASAPSHSAPGASLTGATTTGSTAATNTSGATSTSGYTKTDSDKDNDIGAPADDNNNNSVIDFGHEASAADRRAITALIKRYYAAAAAGDGARACALIHSTLAEAVPEDYGQIPGPPYMRGAKTCRAAMKLLFGHFHTQLIAEAPKLKVTRVQLEEHHGIALLSFGALPEREISITREGHVWRMTALLDGELP